MSEPGDVVRADGRAWMRRRDSFGGSQKLWWMTCRDEFYEWNSLANLKQADDFEWMVKDGIPIVLNALAMYHALDSFADFVVKRGADAELTAERDELLSRLAEMTAQRDRAVAKGSELAADLAESERQRDQALRKLADLQRVVAAAEANEPVLVHPDWRQAEFDELAEERDQLSQELATVGSLRQKLQRRFDDLNDKHNELRRQFDVAVNDRNILRARCDELERGDRHSCGFKCGQQEERRAVVAWLNKDPQGWARQWSLAGRIERGEHDV